MGFQILMTVAVGFGYFLLQSVSKGFVENIGYKKKVPDARIRYVQKYFNALLLALAFVVISVVWSIDYKGLLVLASSFFAVVGVALFAQWSILSNVTSSVIIFFVFPAKIGDRVKILDGDDTIVGQIMEITLFQVLLKDDEGNEVSYPNNLMLQRPTVRLVAVASDELLGSEKETTEQV